jgi:hypothetical protein
MGMKIGILRRAAATALICSAASPLWAAAPDTIELPPPAVDAIVSAPMTLFELDTEMVVKNWVLCVSAAFAEQLVRAREESVEKAATAYADLQQARTCGRVPELRVILQEPLYASTASGHEARAYGALVNLSDAWASAYLVYGGLPDPN